MALAEDVASKTRLSADQAKEILNNLSERLRRALQLETNPASWSDGEVQFKNIAGILLMAPGLEIEVAPKFLGGSPGWREDFFLIATLSSHGRIFNDGLKASSQESSDLLTLIGRCFIDMYSLNRYRPLRTYRRLPYTEFSLEGDFEPEDLSSPCEGGFSQNVTTFTRINSYNAALRAAASALATVVGDVETRIRLERVARHLPRQPPPARLTAARLPSRSRSWQAPYDLALDILRGFGGAFDPKNLMAPGFVVKTWQVWEDLVSYALRLGFGARNVAVKKREVLGSRTHYGAESTMNVIPDCLLQVGVEGCPRHIVVDAKYKGNVDQGKISVSNTDIYEALAFSIAASVKEVVLVYPMAGEFGLERSAAVGTAEEFSTIRVGVTLVRAIEVGVRGLSGVGGMRRFADALKSEICGAT